MSHKYNNQTSEDGTRDTTYAFPAHLLGELDAPVAAGVEPHVSAARLRGQHLLARRGESRLRVWSLVGPELENSDSGRSDSCAS